MNGGSPLQTAIVKAATVENVPMCSDMTFHFGCKSKLLVLTSMRHLNLKTRGDIVLKHRIQVTLPMKAFHSIWHIKQLLKFQCSIKPQGGPAFPK
jgi:hypothetical protein